MKLLRVMFAGCLLVSVYASAALGESSDSAAMRRQALGRQRRVIFNNDGDDYRHSASTEDFLAQRTSRLANSDVDTIFYCTTRGSFDQFSHRTTVGTMVDNENTRHFLARNTDPLQEMIDFCRENDIEIFWALRMNDTHDAGWPRERFEAMDSIKNERPDLLLGSRNRRPLYGAWSAVDYTHREVRDFIVRMVEEVCRNYDIDGIELDFFRHLVFFGKVAWGEEAGPEERAMMTDMVGQIRGVLDRESRRRGRPILLAMRSADDMEYNRQIGLDIEDWMARGWVDMFIPSGYFRLRPWEDSVALGRRHGVEIYAGLSDSRVLGFRSRHESRLLRQWPPGVRGKALNAWDAGVDGVYMFNFFNPRRPEWRELGDPRRLASRERSYFASIRGKGRVPRGAWPYEDFIRIPTLNPDDPLMLSPGVASRVGLRVGEDLNALRDDSPDARVTVRVAAPDLEDPRNLQVALNGQRLNYRRLETDHHPSVEAADGWWVFDPPSDSPPVWRRGTNDVSFLWNGGDEAGQEWSMEYRCDHILTYPEQVPWRRAYHGVPESVEEIRNGTLLLADRAEANFGTPHLVYPWNVLPDDDVVVEARLRVLGTPDPRGVALRMADGRAVAFLHFLADRIELLGTGLSHSMDTTAGFHTYRVELSGDDVVVYVDGREVIDGRGRFALPVSDESLRVRLAYGLHDWNNRSLYMGSATGPGQGESLWEFIRFRSLQPSLPVRDLFVHIEYED